MTPSFLADENFPGDAVQAMRELGYDVDWVRTVAPGISDEAVLRRAVDQRRVLLTLDKDFGELAFRAGLPASCGIILFRVEPQTPEHVVNVATTVLRHFTDWPGHFAVADGKRVRIRPLPSPS